MRLLRFLYVSNLLIATAAAALGAATIYLHGLSVQDQWPRLGFLWLATFGFYGMHDLVTKRHLPNELAARVYRVAFWQRHGMPMLVPLALAALLMGWIALLHFNRHDWFLLLALVLLSLCYTFPLLPLPGLKRWKDHPLAKILVLSGVWTLATTLFLIPPPQVAPAIAFAGARWLFMLLLCIPFDIRDAAADRRHMRSTLPDLLGRNRMGGWITAIAMLAMLFQFLALWQLQQPPVTQVLLAVHLGLTAQLARHAAAHAQPGDLFLLLDLQMLAQALIVGLCGWLT